ncbi:MAG: hypothetical protein ABSC94_02875 [Polyangiaceae bacterium]|jgi:hypothetical protein
MSDEPDEPLLLLRARHCRAGVVGLWAWEATVGLAIAWPAESLARGFFGADPSGDAVLWEAGGRRLLAFLDAQTQAIEALGHAALCTLILAAIGGLLPMCAVMTAIVDASRGRRPPAIGLAASAARLFPTSAALLIAAAVAEILVLCGAMAVFEVLEAWFHGPLGEAEALHLAAVVGAAPSMAIAISVFVMHDLAQGAAVRWRVGAGSALVLGLRALRRAPRMILWSFSWRAGVGLLPILAGAALANRIGGQGDVALVGLGVAHQATIFARVALRVSWLARAMRAVPEPLFHRARSPRYT